MTDNYDEIPPDVVRDGALRDMEANPDFPKLFGIPANEFGTFEISDTEQCLTIAEERAVKLIAYSSHPNKCMLELMLEFAKRSDGVQSMRNMLNNLFPVECEP